MHELLKRGNKGSDHLRLNREFRAVVEWWHLFLSEGYGCEALNSPQRFEAECPICLRVIRDVCSMSYCGQYFCRECIEYVRRERKRCPLCNNEDFSVRDDSQARTSGRDEISVLTPPQRVRVDGSASKLYMCMYVLGTALTYVQCSVTARPSGSSSLESENSLSVLTSTLLLHTQGNIHKERLHNHKR